jgi:hypothetical protein
VTELTQPQAAVLEALRDARLGYGRDELPVETVAELDEAGLLGFDGAGALEEHLTGRMIEWGARTLTQGEILGAFAVHCRDELDDVDVLETTPTRLALRWQSELSALELRAGFRGCERLAGEQPLMLLGDTENELGSLVEKMVADAELRGRLAIYDLERLEKINAVRASAFVYFEWFLRDAYGVKLLPAPAFTRGLIDRGIISLGMG